MMSSVFSGDKTAPLGAATAVYSCVGAAFRTAGAAFRAAKSGVGSMGVMLREQVMKSTDTGVRFGFQSATAEDALIGADDRSVFTPLEKELCGDCLSILASPDPIPDDAKPYLDQVVETKGYGVTLDRPPCLLSKVGWFLNKPILGGRAEDPTTQKYVDRVIGEVLLIEMKKKTGKNYRSLGVERLVKKIGMNCTFLVTIGVVEEDNDDDEDGSSTSVEFIISISGQASLAKPVLGQHFQLREWKLKRASMVVCCALDYPLTIVLYTIRSGSIDPPCHDAIKLPGFTSSKLMLIDDDLYFRNLTKKLCS